MSPCLMSLNVPVIRDQFHGTMALGSVYSKHTGSCARFRLLRVAADILIIAGVFIDRRDEFRILPEEVTETPPRFCACSCVIVQPLSGIWEYF